MRCALCCLLAAVPPLAAYALVLWSTGGIGDEVARICEASSAFRETPRAGHLATAELWEAYVDACRQVFSTMDEGARFHMRMGLRGNRLLRHMAASPTPRVRQPRPTPARLAGCAGARRKTAQELRDDPTYYNRRYLEVGVHPLRERKVPLSEVRGALERGETVKFDATEAFPLSMFNRTLADICELHPETCADTPTWPGQGFRATPLCSEVYDWLQYFTSRLEDWGPWSVRMRVARRLVIPWLLSRRCPGRAAASLAEIAPGSRRLHPDPIPFSYFADNSKAEGAAIHRARTSKNYSYVRTMNVAIGRLPNFFPDDGAIAERLGLGDVVEAGLGLLWAGPTKGDMHVDSEDNVVVQFTECVEAVVIPANCSVSNDDPVFGAFKRDLRAPRKDDWKTEVPFFHMTVCPGEGITLPSLAQHWIMCRRASRIGMNLFMEPRFRKMRWPAAPVGFFHRYDPETAAMRVLWVKSIRHLWNTRKLVYYMHTWRIEYV